MNVPIASTQLKQKSLEELQRIVHQDYGVDLTQDEADQFGFSMLKITRLAIGAFNRAEERSSNDMQLITN